MEVDHHPLLYSSILYRPRTRTQNVLDNRKFSSSQDELNLLYVSRTAVSQSCLLCNILSMVIELMNTRLHSYRLAGRTVLGSEAESYKPPTVIRIHSAANDVSRL
ncbi:hypothetical protein QCA50_003459 [Cerrena zonata]|uniref:Uncharacterized protein n=1 Tax=Cerrena zonata TaxID=2478898 RepID=A0AAW0GWB8_9APHY